MKAKLLIILGGLALLAAMLPLVKSRSTGIEWQKDAASAFTQASARNQAVLLYLNADWCGYCRKMEQTTFLDSEVVSELADKFVWLNLDAEKEAEGIRLRQKFGVDGFPVVLMLTPAEEEVDRVNGYKPPAQFLESIQSFADSEDSFAALQRKAADRSADAGAYFRLARKYIERARNAEAEKALGQVPELDPRNEFGHTDAALFLLARISVGEHRSEEAIRLIDRLQTDFPQSEFVVESQVVRAQALLYAGEEDEARRVLEQFVADHPDHELVPRIRMLMGL